jgi:hypothetical protein
MDIQMIGYVLKPMRAEELLAAIHFPAPRPYETRRTLAERTPFKHLFDTGHSETACLIGQDERRRISRG